MKTYLKGIRYQRCIALLQMASPYRCNTAVFDNDWSRTKDDNLCFSRPNYWYF